MRFLCESVSIQQQECVGLLSDLRFQKKTVLLNDRQTLFGDYLVIIWRRFEMFWRCFVDLASMCV